MSILNIFRREEGGFMDVIRCDESDYLVKKWSPGNGENTTEKEFAIRFGSRLSLRPGEAAVFLYPDDNETPMDIIKGPVSETIKTANFPVLSNIVGSLFGGSSPFLAEVYFFNLETNIQIRFGIPYFDVFDQRFPDLGVPCAVRGTFTFSIGDIANFISQYRLRDLNLDEMQSKIKDLYIRKAKTAVLNIIGQAQIPLMQLETRLEQVSDYIQKELTTELSENFGINLRRVDLSAIELDKTSVPFIQLKSATADLQTRMAGAKNDVEITNLTEVARIQRKDLEMGVEGKNFAVHQVNLQADVLKTAADNLGEMGAVNLGNSGFNPVGMMAGMAIGSSMGNSMGNMMNGMGNTPPPPPQDVYHIAINGQQSGPFTIAQLKEFALTGQFTKDHYVWKAGMAAWEPAANTPVISDIFGQVPPPPPPPTM